MTFLRPTAGRKLRADFGIVAFVGANGGGKTAAMVWDTLPTLEAGRPVLSTVRLLDYENPRPCEDPECHIVGRVEWNPVREVVDLWTGESLVEGGPCDKDDPSRHKQAHPLWRPLIAWPQVMTWTFGDILLDEVSGVASSRSSHAMPDEVVTHLQQLRKGDAIVRWSAPSWKRADTVIREVTQLTVSCRGRMATKHKAEEGQIERRWRQRRLFFWRSYDAYQFEDFTAGARDRLKSMGFDRHWGPGSPVFDAYDTYQKALSLAGTNSATGRCMVCGGRRSVPACSCPKVPAMLPSPVVVGKPGAPLAGSASDDSETAA